MNSKIKFNKNIFQGEDNPFALEMKWYVFQIGSFNRARLRIFMNLTNLRL